jgi:hypothetical protein
MTAGLSLAFIAKSVSLASPGTTERFQIALEDATAVIGQTLVPVFEMLTSVVRTIGDVLATVLPPASSLREVLEPIADTFRELMEALAPVFSVIRDVLVVALKGLAVVVQVLMIPFRILAEVIKAIGSLFGMEEEKLKSSMGAAARNVSFQSSESAAKQIYQAAFRSGKGDPAAQQVGWLAKIHGVCKDIYNLMPGRKKIELEEKTPAEMKQIRQENEERIGKKGARGGLEKARHDIAEHVKKRGKLLSDEEVDTLRKSFMTFHGSDEAAFLKPLAKNKERLGGYGEDRPFREERKRADRLLGQHHERVQDGFAGAGGEF